MDADESEANVNHSFAQDVKAAEDCVVVENTSVEEEHSIAKDSYDHDESFTQACDSSIENTFVKEEKSSEEESDSVDSDEASLDEFKTL